MSTAGSAGYWIADAVTAAANAQWSSASLIHLMDQIGNSVKAAQGQITVGSSRVMWRAKTQGLAAGDHLCEFRSGDLGDTEENVALSGSRESGESDGVEALLEVERLNVESEDLVELFGKLLCAALTFGVGVSAIQMRAELLRLLVVGESRKHQAAGLLAERFKCSVSAGSRRLENTAGRFQISPTGFAAQLLGAGHRGVVWPG